MCFEPASVRQGGAPGRLTGDRFPARRAKIPRKQLSLAFKAGAVRE